MLCGKCLGGSVLPSDLSGLTLFMLPLSRNTGIIGLKYTYISTVTNIMELPVAFVDSTRALLGDEMYRKLALSLDEERVFSLRINPWKTFSGKVEKLPEGCMSVPWSEQGVYLERRLTFTFDPLFHSGCYYVQEPSSMFVEQALRKYAGDAPQTMLDLCAAPGGKSSHACAVLPEGSLLVANEVIRGRSQILAENLAKWGCPATVVTNNDPADFASLGHFFDVLLADVPCSGEGMFRKDPVAVSEWSAENVEICSRRQRRILSDCWACLKPGGILIYSTCTYNLKENEENVRWIRDELGAEILPLDVPQAWNITGNLLSGENFPVYRFLPHRTRGEGFFLAVLRKSASATGITEAEIADSVERFEPLRETFRREKGKKAMTHGVNSYSEKKKQPVMLSKEVLPYAQHVLLDAAAYDICQEKTVVYAFPKNHSSRLTRLKDALRVVRAGIVLGELKGKDIIPAQELAMSRALRASAFPSVEVDYGQAIAYLRKESVSLSCEVPTGYVLLTYRSSPLGFVKNIGNRANNLYPQEWRIRSGYLPEEIRVWE